MELHAKKQAAPQLHQELLGVQQITKNFGGYTAVDDVSLTVNRGEIFGFLGPNGAGKTTTIKILAGLLRPDTGAVWINRESLHANPLACKQMTGYIPDRPYLYEKLTGQEFLGFIASLYHLDEEKFLANTDAFLQLFDLTEWRDHLIESYSHGMRQKLIMASVFMLDPPLIIVDEPMIGLDPKSARIVKELFKTHARKGGGVFLSTHSLEIAEELCDRIAIIQHGRIIAAGDMESLRRKSRMADSGLEDIFIELTGAFELHQIVQALRE